MTEKIFKNFIAIFKIKFLNIILMKCIIYCLLDNKTRTEKYKENSSL